MFTIRFPAKQGTAALLPVGTRPERRLPAVDCKCVEVRNGRAVGAVAAPVLLGLLFLLRRHYPLLMICSHGKNISSSYLSLLSIT